MDVDRLLSVALLGANGEPPWDAGAEAELLELAIDTGHIGMLKHLWSRRPDGPARTRAGRALLREAPQQAALLMGGDTALQLGLDAEDYESVNTIIIEHHRTPYDPEMWSRVARAACEHPEAISADACAILASGAPRTARLNGLKIRVLDRAWAAAGWSRAERTLTDIIAHTDAWSLKNLLGPYAQQWVGNEHADMLYPYTQNVLGSADVTPQDLHHIRELGKGDAAHLIESCYTRRTQCLLCVPWNSTGMYPRIHGSACARPGKYVGNHHTRRLRTLPGHLLTSQDLADACTNLASSEALLQREDLLDVLDDTTLHLMLTTGRWNPLAGTDTTGITAELVRILGETTDATGTSWMEHALSTSAYDPLLVNAVLEYSKQFRVLPALGHYQYDIEDWSWITLADIMGHGLEQPAIWLLKTCGRNHNYHHVAEALAEVDDTLTAGQAVNLLGTLLDARDETENRHGRN